MKHIRNPLKLDMRGDWDGVVVFDRKSKEFVRFLDRNGERHEPVKS